MAMDMGDNPGARADCAGCGHTWVLIDGPGVLFWADPDTPDRYHPFTIPPAPEG